MKVKMVVLLSGIVTATIVSSFGQNGKFEKTETLALRMGCGNGLDDNSPIGACGRLEGVAFTKYASGGHVCVQLPGRLKGKDVTLSAPAAGVGTGPSVRFQPCGNGDAL